MHDELYAQILDQFILESRERSATLQRLLLAMETSDDGPVIADSVAAAFREIHSLKGVAFAVSQETLGTICHAIETIFAELMKGELAHSPALVDVLLWGVDVIQAAIEGLSGGKSLDAAVGRRIAEALANHQRQPELLPHLTATNANANADADDTATETATPASVGTPSSAPEKPVARPTAKSAGGSSAASASASTSDPGPEIDRATIRVRAEQIDHLINQGGELLISRAAHEATGAELADLERRLNAWKGYWRHNRVSVMESRDMTQIAEALESALDFIFTWSDTVGEIRQRVWQRNQIFERATRELQDELMATRMVPANVLFQRFPRVVRDVSRQLNRDVKLQLDGENCKLDWVVMERVQDPLVHLIRNAIDHGIEPPADREAAGKPRTGTVSVRAFVHGSAIVLEVEDDGRGFDPTAIRARAMQSGYFRDTAAETLTSRELIDLIFTSGFSTAERVTDVSGRGMGLDVVKTNIEAVGGIIDVRSQPGVGTCFSLRVPITLATFKGVIVRSRGSLFAVPQTSVVRFIRFRPSDVYTLKGTASIHVDGRPTALANLADVLGQPVLASALPPWYKALVVQSAERRVAFLVDDVVDEREMVVKNLGRYFRRVRHFAGATVLGNGEVVPILNIADCVRTATDKRIGTGVTEAADKPAERRKSILVVDDSITTRTLERNILESEGYRVNVAVDGLEAQELLEKMHFDLVVSDIEMPRLDGLGLTRWVRQESRLKQLPIILVSSRNAPADRRAGLEAGADAYINKQSFSQETLIETISRLL